MGDVPAETGALSATGVAEADAAQRMVVAAFERTFPERIRAYYTLGSFADASALNTSDLDITIVFKGKASIAEHEAATYLSSACARQSAIELDIEIEDEETLARGASPSFKLGSALIAGEDIRDRLPLVSLTEWTRDRMHSSWWRVARLFARPAIITLPLDYPEAEEAFRGYTRRTVRLATGVRAPSTRDLIRLTGWMATALLALKSNVYVARKSEVHGLYRERIGGEWASLIEKVYALCRVRWAYRIPADPAERVSLRDLCDHTLAFEQTFASTYRDYLLAELSGDDTEGARFAAEAMNHAPLCDDMVIAALATLAHRDDEVVASLARSALAQLQPSQLDA